MKSIHLLLVLFVTVYEQLCLFTYSIHGMHRLSLNEQLESSVVNKLQVSIEELGGGVTEIESQWELGR